MSAINSGPGYPTQQAGQSAVTAATVLGEERHYVRVQFAVTGVVDADFLAGIAAVITELGIENKLRFKQRIFEYLAVTIKDAADKMDEVEKQRSMWEQFDADRTAPAPDRAEALRGIGQLYKATAGASSALPPPSIQGIEHLISRSKP